jgi:hypothetical protein
MHHRLTSTLSARCLATLAESPLDPPDGLISSTSHGEVGGWQVTVTICRYDGPVRLVLTPAGERELPETAKQLRDIELDILEAAPKPTEPPITMKRLAQVAGYGWNCHYRNAVNALVERGMLARVRGGVRRSAAQLAPQQSCQDGPR